MINARAEGIESKNAYRKAFKSRRCIIPADGFYEWVKVPGQKNKQPVFLTRTDGEPIAFAGLWEQWRDLQTCAVITTRPRRTRRWRRCTIACR